MKEKPSQSEIVTDERLGKVVGKVLDAITVSESDNALILAADGMILPNGLRVARVFAEGIQKRGGKAQVVTFTPRQWEEPRDPYLTELLLRPEFNFVIVPDIDHIGHDGRGRETPYLIGEKKFTEAIYYRRAKNETRAFWFMVDDLQRFIESVDVDFNALGKVSKQLEEEFQKASSIKFCSGGTEVLEFATRQDITPMADFDFEQDKLGAGGNIPMGEVLITPNNKTGEGTLVVDESFYLDDTVVCQEPVTLRFADGHVTTIEGGEEARLLHEFLLGNVAKTKEAMQTNSDITPEYLSNIYRIGEFAIGVDPGATFGGHLLFGEKVYASAHIALGRSYHGDPAFNHIDLVVKQPKIVFIYPDGSEKVIVDQGQIFLAEGEVYPTRRLSKLRNNLRVLPKRLAQRLRGTNRDSLKIVP